jgi:hypothetical protein
MWGAQQNMQADAAGAIMGVPVPSAGHTAGMADGQPADAPLPGAEAAEAGVPGNGAAAQGQPQTSPEQAQTFWRGKLAGANFGGAVSLYHALARAPALYDGRPRMVPDPCARPQSVYGGRGETSGRSGGASGARAVGAGFGGSGRKAKRGASLPDPAAP